jgi:hypothetical protein
MGIKTLNISRTVGLMTTCETVDNTQDTKTDSDTMITITDTTINDQLASAQPGATVTVTGISVVRHKLDHHQDTQRSNSESSIIEYIDNPFTIAPLNALPYSLILHSPITTLSSKTIITEIPTPIKLFSINISVTQLLSPLSLANMHERIINPLALPDTVTKHDIPLADILNISCSTLDKTDSNPIIRFITRFTTGNNYRYDRDPDNQIDQRDIAITPAKSIKNCTKLKTEHESTEEIRGVLEIKDVGEIRSTHLDYFMWRSLNALAPTKVV